MSRLWLALLFLFLATGSGLLAQSAGDSEGAVVAALGQPSMARTTGDRRILVYPDGTTIVLEAGVVVESSGPSSDGRGTYRNNAVECESPSRARAVDTTRSRREAKPRRSQAEGSNAPSGAGVLFFGVGLLIILVCSVIFIVAAFSESVLWGLGVLFVPLVPLIFLILHWSTVKRSFLVSLLVGFPLCLIGAVMLQPA